MNNLKALGLQESMYCHFVRVIVGDQTSFETTTFFLNQHLAARINQEMNQGCENFQQGQVQFPFVAQLEPLTDTNNLLKKLGFPRTVFASKCSSRPADTLINQTAQKQPGHHKKPSRWSVGLPGWCFIGRLHTNIAGPSGPDHMHSSLKPRRFSNRFVQ